MTMLIRETTDDDAPALVAIAREVMPELPITEETWRHRRQTIPERGRPLSIAADEDGEVVGRGDAGLNWLAGTHTG
jgi:hypothetical protein